MSDECDAMPESTALEVARIMMTADGGCFHCAAQLLQQMQEQWPSTEQAIDKVWVEEGYASVAWANS